MSPVCRGDLVLDLGAGRGALTGPLVHAGATVLAVELHAGRARRLTERFAADPVRVVVADLAELRLPGRPFRVVASPPYGHTTELVRRLLTGDRLVSADLVLQRAAARRLVERSGRGRGRFRLHLGLSVPRRAFDPMPRVDSVVLQIRRQQIRRR
jgi:23S rRNA (adenine-N6)-dimethyltransferase